MMNLFFPQIVHATGVDFFLIPQIVHARIRTLMEGLTPRSIRVFRNLDIMYPGRLSSLILSYILDTQARSAAPVLFHILMKGQKMTNSWVCSEITERAVIPHNPIGVHSSSDGPLNWSPEVAYEARPWLRWLWTIQSDRTTRIRHDEK